MVFEWIVGFLLKSHVFPDKLHEVYAFDYLFGVAAERFFWSRLERFELGAQQSTT